MFSPTLTTFANLAPPWSLATLDANFAALSAQLAASASWAVAGGTADAITATYNPVNLALTDGLILGVRASAANATTTPTFAPDGFPAHTITKGGGVALVAGDIPGALAEFFLRYNLANTRWELMNPATLSSVSGSWTPSVGGSATYTTQTGTYVKIANQVTLLGTLVINVIGSGSASTISGLPFTVGAQGGHGLCSQWSSLAVNATAVFLHAGSATTSMTISGVTVGAASSSTLSALQNGATIVFSVTYFL